MSNVKGLDELLKKLDNLQSDQVVKEALTKSCLIVEAEAKDFTHREDVCELQSTIERMVVYNYNRIGTEGLNSESYSGTSYKYTTDYPEQILKMRKRYRKIVTL